MIEWLNEFNSTYRVYTHSNDGICDTLHLIFANNARTHNRVAHEASMYISGLEYDNPKLQDIITKLNGHLHYTYRDGVKIYTKYYLWNEGYLSLKYGGSRPTSNDEEDIPDGAITVDIYTTNEQTIKWLVQDFKALHSPRTNNQGKIYVMVNGQGGLGLTSIGKAAVEFIPGNYNKHVVEDYNYIIENIQAKDPNGRIVIMDGPAGSGKTYALRAILNSAPKATFILVPSNTVESLADPTFMEFFLRYQKAINGPTVLVIEDADRCLVPRAADNISIISTLLNMTDGIIGQLLDIRVLATTNASLDQIDAAIMRPGRLMKHTHIGELSPERAAEVYKRLTGNDIQFDESTTLAQVYFLAKNKGIKNEISDIKPKHKMGFYQ